MFPRPALCLSTVLFVIVAAGPARAQLAVAATLPDADPGHRDVAAGIVNVASTRWQTLFPPLHPDVTAACRGEPSCLVSAARARGATHLLLVGVAGAGRRDHIVTLQLLDADARPLLDDTAIVFGGDDARATGVAAAAPLLRIDGPPPAGAPRAAGPVGENGEVTSPATTSTATTAAAAVTPWTVAGTALVGAGAVLGIVTAASAMLARPADEAGQWLVVSGASAAAAVAVAGVACVVVDAPPSLPREQGENARIGD